MPSTPPASRHLRGLSDYSEVESIVFQKWLSSIRDAYALFGFVPLELRPFELTSTLVARGGLSKQIFGVYRLQDGQPTEFALPFDRTVPFAVWTAQNHRRLSLPFRRSDVSLSFRGERPQAGRLLAFYQADVDIVGRNLDLTADADCIAAVDAALRALAIPQFTICLNHIELARSLIRRYGIEAAGVEEALRLIDKLDKSPAAEVAQALSKCGAGSTLDAAMRLVEIFQYRGSVEGFVPGGLDSEGERALLELRDLGRNLEELGVSPARVALAPARVRGLTYYSGAVFETLLTDFEGYGSVASGGRYDNLVGSFASSTAADIQGVGGSIGVSRLFDIARKEGWFPAGARSLAEVLVGARVDDQSGTALRAAASLRGAGLSTEVAHVCDVRKQLQLADKKGIPVVVLVMGPESFVVKSLADGKQVEADEIGLAVRAACEFARGCK